jgi:hypothetical protein
MLPLLLQQVHSDIQLGVDAVHIVQNQQYNATLFNLSAATAAVPIIHCYYCHNPVTKRL